MKFSTLLLRRAALLRQARLANLAYAYASLARFGQRIARAKLRGVVNLKSPAPELERYDATLTAWEGSQSVLDEHFAEDELLELADVVAFVSGHAAADETFRLEEFDDKFLAPLRSELARAGVALDDDTSALPDAVPNRGPV